jgi:hypothetical protein
VADCDKLFFAFKEAEALIASSRPLWRLGCNP